MNRQLCRLFAVVLCLLNLSQRGWGASALSPFELRLYGSRNARVIQDAVRCNFSKMAGEDWVLAQIDKESIESYGLLTGAQIRTKKRHSIESATTQSVYILLGDFQKFMPLKGGLKSVPNYRWERPLVMIASRGTSEDTQIYSPFYSGGTVIFRYIEKATNEAKFDSVRLVPDEWAEFVLAAFQFQQANKALFDETKVAANLKPLTLLLADKNPFNAIAAARVLAPERGLDAAFVENNLASSSGYLQAIFAYLTFKNAHPVRQAAIDEALGQVIDKAPSVATLKWITLGLTAAQNDDANSYFALKDRAKALLLRVDKKQKTLNTKTVADDYINELLMATQVRERPAAPETRRIFQR